MNTSIFNGSQQFMLACLLLVLLNLGEKTNAFSPNSRNQRSTGNDHLTQLQLQQNSQQTQPSQQYHQQYHQQYQQHEWQQQQQQQQQYQRTAHLMMVAGPVQSDRASTSPRSSSTSSNLPNYRFLSSARNNHYHSPRNVQDSALDASSLFLDIPTDPEILKTAAMVFVGGFSWGTGISWLIEEQAEAFRRRFFRKAEAEGGDIPPIPPQYSTQPQTTTLYNFKAMGNESIRTFTTAI